MYVFVCQVFNRLQVFINSNELLHALLVFAIEKSTDIFETIILNFIVITEAVFVLICLGIG